ncbi:MAG: hypothetical protein ACRCTA_04615, partial [Bacilli bacterium]
MSFFEALSYILINLVIPIAVIVALVWLTLVLIELRTTTKKFNKIADEIESKLDLLDGPINSILLLKDSVDSIINSLKTMADTIN